MSFKKILPWLAGILVVIVAFAAVPLSRLFLFNRALRLNGLAQEGLRRGVEGAPGFGGPMMGAWGGRMGGLMGGFEIIILPLFFVALFLFTFWAVIKIVRSSSPSAAASGRTCPKCGQGVAHDWKHCPHCGAEINQPPAEPPVSGA